jgi:hypothetical protein
MEVGAVAVATDVVITIIGVAVKGVEITEDQE